MIQNTFGFQVDHFGFDRWAIFTTTGHFLMRGPFKTKAAAGKVFNDLREDMDLWARSAESVFNWLDGEELRSLDHYKADRIWLTGVRNALVAVYPIAYPEQEWRAVKKPGDFEAMYRPGSVL